MSRLHGGHSISSVGITAAAALLLLHGAALAAEADAKAVCARARQALEAAQAERVDYQAWLRADRSLKRIGPKNEAMAKMTAPGRCGQYNSASTAFWDCLWNAHIEMLDRIAKAQRDKCAEAMVDAADAAKPPPSPDNQQPTDPAAERHWTDRVRALLLRQRTRATVLAEIAKGQSAIGGRNGGILITEENGVLYATDQFLRKKPLPEWMNQRVNLEQYAVIASKELKAKASDELRRVRGVNNIEPMLRLFMRDPLSFKKDQLWKDGYVAWSVTATNTEEIMSPGTRIHDEGATIKGTINGGGDFIHWQPPNRLIEPRATAPRYHDAPRPGIGAIPAAAGANHAVRGEAMRFVLPSVRIDTRDFVGVIELSPSTLAAVGVIAGEATVHELESGRTTRATAGMYAFAVPGIGVTQAAALPAKLRGQIEATIRRLPPPTRTNAANGPHVRELRVARNVADGRPVSSGDRFAADDQPVSVWLALDFVTNAIELRAHWQFLGGPDPRDIGVTKVAVAAGAGWARFENAQPSGRNWPVGDYRVAVFHGDRKLATASFSFVAARAAVDWPARLAAGKPAAVVLDATAAKFDDAGWRGADDPLGTIKGGETYRIALGADGWTATGFNEGTGATGTWTYPGGRPEDHEFNIWGYRLRFDDAGRVLDRKWGVIGRLAPVD